jgi:hypothetical protein
LHNYFPMLLDLRHTINSTIQKEISCQSFTDSETLFADIFVYFVGFLLRLTNQFKLMMDYFLLALTHWMKNDDPKFQGFSGFSNFYFNVNLIHNLFGKIWWKVWWNFIIHVERCLSSLFKFIFYFWRMKQDFNWKLSIWNR